VPDLLSGVKYLPVLIGLFGLTEVFNVMSRRTAVPIPKNVGRVVPPLSFLRKYWKSALRSSIVGTVIGVIPGAGANISAFVSYNFGERATGRKFTNGDIEGVVCSEVANNATCGGALLPTTTLGIPGNSSTALLLAALAMHGVTMGPNINNDAPGFMHFLYASLLSANFFMYTVAFLLIRPSVYLLSMPSGAVMPTIVMLCLVGTFAASYSTFDVGVMFISGAVGYILYRGGYPFAPLILGLILGPMADENLRRTIWVYDGRFHELIYRPVGLVLLAAVIWSFYYGFRRSLEEGAKLKAKAKSAKAIAAGNQQSA
jgi:putative tricarboxylic transport membrane protein